MSNPRLTSEIIIDLHRIAKAAPTFGPLLTEAAQRLSELRNALAIAMDDLDNSPPRKP